MDRSALPGLHRLMMNPVRVQLFFPFWCDWGRVRGIGPNNFTRTKGELKPRAPKKDMRLTEADHALDDEDRPRFCTCWLSSSINPL
jgi:hypothetical protein